MEHVNIFDWDSIETKYPFPNNPTLGVKIVNGENMQMVWARYESGTSYKLHSHSREQFSFMLTGRMKLKVGSITKEIKAGDIWYVPSNVVHGGEALGDDPIIFVDIYSPPNPDLKIL